MAKPTRMPKASSERLQDTATGSALPNLVRELAVDGLRWADAEIALAKAEAGVLLRSYITGLAVALAGFATFIAAVVILAQSGVIALTPYLSSESLAGLVIGLVLLAVVIVLAILARHLLTQKPPATGLIFQWLTGTAPQKGQK
jgi:uncharacterized membrane protein